MVQAPAQAAAICNGTGSDLAATEQGTLGPHQATGNTELEVGSIQALVVTYPGATQHNNGNR